MAEGKQIVVQTRLGEKTITEDRVVSFPRGLIGFESLQRFTLLQIRDDSPFLILQSLDEPDFGILVTDPYMFLASYEVRVSDSEQKLLGIKDLESLAILVTVSIPSGRPEQTTLNLSGPIIINTLGREGMQIPQTDSAYPSHFLLGDTSAAGHPSPKPVARPEPDSKPDTN